MCKRISSRDRWRPWSAAYTASGPRQLDDCLCLHRRRNDRRFLKGLPTLCGCFLSCKNNFPLFSQRRLIFPRPKMCYFKRTHQLNSLSWPDFQVKQFLPFIRQSNIFNHQQAIPSFFLRISLLQFYLRLSFHDNWVLKIQMADLFSSTQCLIIRQNWVIIKIA